MAHHAFRARTVIVGEGGPLAAYQTLTKIMNSEGGFCIFCCCFILFVSSECKMTQNIWYC